MFSGMARPMIRLRPSLMKPKSTEARAASVAKPSIPISRHQTVRDVDLAEFFQIFQTSEADLFAGAFQDAGAMAESVFPIIAIG
jgi:hypothetical protein